LRHPLQAVQLTLSGFFLAAPFLTPAHKFAPAACAVAPRRTPVIFLSGGAHHRYPLATCNFNLDTAKLK